MLREQSPKIAIAKTKINENAMCREMKKENETETREMSAPLEVREVDGVKQVYASVSSELPYLKYIRFKDVRGYEVLGHRADEVDFSRIKDGMVVQDGHYGDQIGIIDNPEIKDGKLCGLIRFGHSQRAKEIEADALSGIRRNLSVGYFIYEMKEEERAADGMPVFRATRWTPFEASFVNVPADPTVGVGRDMEHDDNNNEGGTTAEIKEENEMDEEKMKNAISAAVDPLLKQCEELHGQIRELKERKPEMPTAARSVGPFDDGDKAIIRKRYSITRAIAGMADPRIDCGFEREVSDQIAKMTGKQARGMFVPEVALRTMTGKTNVPDHITGAGGNTVATELLASQYIDALVAETVLGRLGVRTMAGLVGDIAIPTGSAVTAGWQSAEDVDATTVTPSFAQITGTPHTATGTANITRKLLLQSSLGVDSLISRLIIEAIGRKIEEAAFEGAGTFGAPTGLANTSNVGSVSMTANKPTKANLVDFWKTILSANAGTDSLKFVMSPAVKALLCKTMDVQLVKNAAATDNVGGVGGRYLCDRDSTIEGYEVVMSNLCNANKIYFGNWSDMILAFWSGVDMVVDPYTYSAKGAIQVSAFQDCDVLIRHPESFAIGTAAS